MIRTVLATCTVTDLERAERWYTTLLDGGPDARPMAGLLEWRLGDGRGIQVWSEPDRAGASGAVLEVDDLDAIAARLAESGLTSESPSPGGGARILQLADPDGNRIVLTGH